VADKPAFYGWRLIGVLACVDFLNLGFPAYGGAVINSYMLRDIPMSRSELGLGFTLLNLFVGVPSTLVALSILKRGLRGTYVIGCALVLLGSLFLALRATQPWHYVLGFGVINGIGICFGDIVCATTAAARWFERYRGRANALVLSGSGVCGFLMAPVLDKIIRTSGGQWRLGWEIIAGGAVLAAILVLFFVEERPEDLGQHVDGIPPEKRTPDQEASHSAPQLISRYEWTPSEAYRTRTYWMVVIGGLAAQFPFFFFTAHWIEHLQGVGVASSVAALALGVFTVSGIVGRLIGGWLVDKMTARYAFMIGLCCCLIGSVAAIYAGPNALWLTYAAAALYGLCIGWTFTCMTTCVAHFYGPAAFPKLAGMLLLLTSGGASPAGIVGGKIFDMYGSYTRAFELNFLITLIGIAAMAFATMPRPQQPRELAAERA